MRVEEGTFLQGCWLDWDVIRRDLLERAADLVPGASLEPVLAQSESRPTRMLASLPVRLVPGSVPDEPEPRVVARPALALDRLGVPGACRGGGRAGAPRGACLERAPGDLCLGRDPRASHPADDVSPLHRDARRGDGRRAPIPSGRT